MNPKSILPAVFACVVAGPSATAQSFQPDIGAEAIVVRSDGRLLVRNGEDQFDCALATRGNEVALDDCQAVSVDGSDPLATIAALSDEDWQANIRSTLLDADCKLSAFRAVGDVIEATAVANGATPDQIEGLRAAMSERAEEAIDRMVRDGSVTVRDGELALDSCK